jgi:glycine dehydrogenase subunit 1
MSRFTPVCAADREVMLRSVGAASIDDLFADIPEDVRLGRPLDLPDSMTEMELAAHLRDLADSCTPASRMISFAGAGCYDHYVPAIVDHVIRKPAFFTAYTPYQPEVSQGTLQNIYEYQTMICELTGMDVANASMYDGATALAEAALMSARVTKRREVVVAECVHPEWRRVLATYAGAGVVLDRTCRSRAGVVDLDDLKRSVGEGTAAVLVSSPNFYGSLEDLGAIAEIAHGAGALLVVATNPALAGVLEPPSAFGADIVVGEGQPLGNAMSFGGPGFGFFAAREESLRQMPGRIVGRTVDVDGAMGFVLTMQTREQHIRREKATSNICSNHALNALAAAVYLSAVGAEGLAEVGRACVSKAHYLREKLLATGKFSSRWDAPFAHEFALAYAGSVDEMREILAERGYVAGVSVGEIDAEWPTGLGEKVADSMVLFAVTEKRTKAEMDAFAEEVAAL